MHLHSSPVHVRGGVVNEELRWIRTDHVLYFHSHWAFSFHWAVNASSKTAQEESICKLQRDNLLLNNPALCKWVTGPYQSTRRLIKVERGSGWIKDQLIKMSREHASPRFVYRLVHGWVKKERGEIGVKEEKKNQVCLTSSDIRGYIIKCYITMFGYNQRRVAQLSV